MAEANALLDALLAESGMSHQGFASRLNRAGNARNSRRTLRYDHTSVTRWLRGERPRDPVPELICMILSDRLGRTLTCEDVGLGPAVNDGETAVPLERSIDRATALWRADESQRSDVQNVDVLTGMRAITPVWEWENPPEDDNVSRRGSLAVGAMDVQILIDARSHYEVMYRYSGGLTARSRLVTFLTEQMAPLLTGRYTDQVGRQLHRAASGLAALAGICSYDAEHHGIAQRYFHQALRLAKSSGDRRFGAYVIALMVNQSLALGEFRQAVGFSESALRSAASAMSPALTADLRVMQAKAYAQMGDSSATYAAMAEAESAAAHIGQGEEPPETSYVQPGLVEAQLAEALISLGDLSPAQRYAEAALHTNVHPRGRVNRLASVATLELRRGDAERASTLAMEMVERAQGMESRRLHDRFRKLRTALAGCPTSVTAEAVERIDRTLHIAR